MKYLIPILIVLALFIKGCDSAPDIEDPPDLLFSGTQAAYTDELFNFTIEAEDPQGVDFDLMVEDLPEWLTFIPNDATLSGTPTADDEGIYLIRVTADNGERARTRDLRIRVFSDRDEELFQGGIDELVSSFATNISGISVALIDRHENLYRAFRGTYTLSNEIVPIDQNSLFRVASVTKPFTTALVLQFAEEGLIDLEDPLTDYIETELPNADRITIRQMLSHTAGVYDHLNSSSFWSSPLFTPVKVWSTEEIVNFAVENGPLFDPGSDYRYSNTGFYQLKTLIEEVSGVPLKQAYRERLIEPLGLTRTLYDDFSTSSNPIENLTLNSRSYEYHLTAAGPAGAIASTATDIAMFGRKLYGDRLLNSELTEQLNINIGEEFDGQNYGLGTRIWELGGIPHHGHTGALLDYRNILMYIPQADLTVAIHTQEAHSNWFTLVDAIFDYSVQNFSDGLVKPIPFEYGVIPREEPYLNR